MVDDRLNPVNPKLKRLDGIAQNAGAGPRKTKKLLRSPSMSPRTRSNWLTESADEALPDDGGRGLIRSGDFEAKPSRRRAARVDPDISHIDTPEQVVAASLHSLGAESFVLRTEDKQPLQPLKSEIDWRLRYNRPDLEVSFIGKYDELSVVQARRAFCLGAALLVLAAVPDLPSLSDLPDTFLLWRSAIRLVSCLVLLVVAAALRLCHGQTDRGRARARIIVLTTIVTVSACLSMMAQDTIGHEWDASAFSEDGGGDRASTNVMVWMSFVALSTQLRFKLALSSAICSMVVHAAVLSVFSVRNAAARIDYNGLVSLCTICIVWSYHTWLRGYDRRCEYLFMSKVGKRMTNLKQRKHKMNLKRLESSDDAAAVSKSATVWVGGIPQSAVQSDKSEMMLTQVFAKYGDVVSVSVRKKSGDKSWAFVTFCLPESVEKCLGVMTTMEDSDGCVVELQVKAAEVDKKLSDGAGTGALKSMWSNQVIQVKKTITTPMESILEILEKVAVVSPSTAGQIEEAVQILTTSGDLWTAAFDAEQGMEDLRGFAAPEMRRRPSQVGLEETQQFLLA
eukprot:SAG22_NODE_2777_length_2222_cov_1.769195_1_plen_564_part_10